MGMKVGERGQVTIPKEIREQFGIGPETEIDFLIQQGEIVVRKRTGALPLRAWKGYCAKEFRKGGSKSVDDFLEGVRGKV